MAFDLGRFVRFTYLALFRSRGTNYRLTPKRLGLLAAFYVCFPLLELMTWVGFLLDEILFREYRQRQVSQPVFILGNPRSGSTSLHRLMAKDAQNFTTMMTWEIFFAPSITLRRLWRVLAALDSVLGSPIHNVITALEEWWQERNVTHALLLQAPEEDEFVLLHAWSTLAIYLFSAVMDEAQTYTRFDTAMTEVEKRRIMSFYRRCLQRHLYAHRSHLTPGRRYLAKSPALTPKVSTLNEWFPDARFICLVRNPLDVIPSYISVMELQWRTLADPVTPWASRDYVLDMAQHWYTYPLERLRGQPEDRHVFVKYDDLVHDPERTVRGIYHRLRFQVSSEFAHVLHVEAERTRDYRSKHHYSLEQMGLTRDQIIAEYRDVYERFGLDLKEQTG